MGMRVKERVKRWVFAASASVCIAAVALICIFLFANGLPFFSKVDVFSFLTGTKWAPDVTDSGSGVYGILPMIVGSLYVTAGALVIGGPIGILGGVYLARFCPTRLRKVLLPMV